MPVGYTNRKDDVYYLHVGKTKTGNPKYHFSKKKKGDLADSIPDGYEIYENPNAQVFLRKVVPKLVTDEEIAIVENGVRELAKLDLFIIDVKRDCIEVHLPDQTRDAVEAFSRQFGAQYSKALGDILIRSAMYSPMMRFVLADKESRVFTAERWCFRGAVDDWIVLGVPGALASLVKQYCPHLGKGSFYGLM